MAKKIILTILILCVSKYINGQSQFIFDSLIINNAIDIKDADLLISGFTYGPTISIVFTVENNSDSVIVLKNAPYYLGYSFNKYIPFLSLEYSVNGEKTEKEIDFCFSENEFLISPHSKQSYDVELELALPFFDYSNEYITIIDHSRQFFEILSSLRLLIRINENKLYSLTPLNIIIGENFVNYYRN